MGEDQNHTGIISKDLINWKSNTLTERLHKFSTLSVLYDSSKMLDQAFETMTPPNSSSTTERYEQIAEVWKLLLNQFTRFHDAISRPAKFLPKYRNWYLCLRPTGQLIVIAVISHSLKLRDEILLEEVIERLNKVDWGIENPLWKGVVIIEGRVKAGERTIRLASLLIAYLIGIPLSDLEMSELQAGYGKAKREAQEKSLPQPLFPLFKIK